MLSDQKRSEVFCFNGDTVNPEDRMPKAKVGKTYPVSYFAQVNQRFQPKAGIFEFLGWKFERMGRNQVKVLEIPGVDYN